MSVEKRSVVTDALETLGTIIDEKAKRDAIHVAVEPVVAAQDLMPGQSVGVDGTTDNPVGIVDPFLIGRVFKGQRFWLLLYPRQITSLRHVWSHPAFPEEEQEKVYTEEEKRKIEEVEDTLDTGGAKKWIKDFAYELGQSYEDLMEAADRHVNKGEDTKDNSEKYKDLDHKFPEFWEKYEKVTGVNVASRDNFFYCSC